MSRITIFTEFEKQQERELAAFKRKQKKESFLFLEQKLNELPEFYQNHFWQFMNRFGKDINKKDMSKLKVEYSNLSRWIYDLQVTHQSRLLFEPLLQKINEAQKIEFILQLKKELEKNFDETELLPWANSLSTYIYCISYFIDKHFLFSYLHKEIEKYELLSMDRVISKKLSEEFNKAKVILDF